MKVEHNEKERKFLLKISDGECAIMYKKVSDKVWDFYYTFIPPVSGKEDIKDKIINYVLSFVKDNNIKIKASCISIQNFLLRNRHLKEVLYFPY